MERRDTLLLVNDSPAVRAALQTAFEKGFNLLEAENGEQALLLMEENHRCITAVVLDTKMPVKSGQQVLAEMRLRGLLDELPVVILTEESGTELEVQLFDAGASEVICAPYDLYVVQRRVRNIVALSQSRWKLEDTLEKQSRLPQHTSEVLVDALTSIIEYRTPESGLHIPRIRRFTQLLLDEVARSCPEYGLTPAAITMIASAATFHDVGKISIPDSILNKPGRLTADEKALIQTHSLSGCHILESITQSSDQEYLQYARDICHYHHERWDGGGYPDGLKGDDIPICAQVVGLADVYDALTSKQVYKPAYPHGLAMNMILNGECGSFSPKLLECLKQVGDRFAEVTVSYEDSVLPSPNRTLSGAALPVGGDSLQSLQMKYQALLYHLDATVMEVDLDHNFYHLVYNTDPGLADLAGEPSFISGIPSLLRHMAKPEDLDALAAWFSEQVRMLFDSGQRRYTSTRELYSFLSEQKQWYDFTFLHIEPADSPRRRILVLFRPMDGQPPQAEKSSVSSTAIYSLLAGVFCCRNDLWLTLLGDCAPLTALLGYTEEQFRSRFQNRLMNLILPEDRQRIRRQMGEQLSQGRNAELEFRLRRQDGQIIWVLCRGHLMLEDHGVERLYCVLVNITQTKQTLDHLQQSLERHQIIMAQTDDVVFEWNMRTDTTSFSGKWMTLFGYEPIGAEFTQHLAITSHIHPDDLPPFLERMELLKNGSDYQEAELRIAKSDGRYLWCRVRATAQYDSDGKPYKAVGVIINIDAEKCAALALQSKAERDPLTKLLNKNASRQQVETRLLSRLPEEHAALLILDLDDFKQVNDHHGHLFGDTVLTQAAAELRRFFRADDILARIGGDEFMIYMSSIPDQELVTQRCSNMLRSFHNLFLDRLPGQGLSCSVGIALAPEHGVSFRELFQRADLALYRAKAQGKNQFAIYQSTDRDFLPMTPPATAIDSEHADKPET